MGTATSALTLDNPAGSFGASTALDHGLTTPDQLWVSARLFHRGNIDDLITGAVARVIRKLRSSDTLESFHFERGWEGGPHVRLHLLSPDPSKIAVIRETITSYAGRYFAEHPSPSSPDAEVAYRASAARMAAVEGRTTFDPHLRPTDTVEFVPYVFDHDTYGNGPAREAAEHQFAESSRIALRMIQSGTSLEHRHSALLGMLMLTLAVLEPDIEAAARRVRRIVAPSESIPRAGAALRRQARDLWSCAAGTGRYPLRGPLLAWLRSMRILREQLRAARRSGAFVPAGHRSPLAPLAAAASPQTRGVAHMLLLATHLLCNRLAISPVAEARLGGLVTQALIELDQEAGRPVLAAVGTS